MFLVSEEITRTQRHAITAALAIVASGAQWIVSSWTGEQIPFLLFITTIALTAPMLGRQSAAAILITGFFVGLFLLTQQGGFRLHPLSSSIVVAAYGLVGLLFVFTGGVVRATFLRMSQTERQLYEEKLRVGEDEMRRLRAMFMQAPGFMAILDGPDHVVEFSNAANDRLLGCRPLLGKPLLRAIPELVDQTFSELLDKVYQSGEPYTAYGVPMRLQCVKDGPPTTLFIDFIYQPLCNDQGRVTKIFVQGSDVTESHRTAEQMRVIQSRLEEGMHAAKMTVWDWNKASDQIVFSDNAADIYGDEGDILRHPWMAIHPNDIPLFEDARDNQLPATGQYAVTLRFIRPDTKAIIWLELRGKAVFDADGKLLAVRGVSIDVTARKTVEEQLRESERRKNEFLAMLAHELRNPLAPILSVANMLNKQVDDKKKITLGTEILTRQVTHIATLLDDLLDVSRVTRGVIKLERKKFDIRTVTDSAVEQVRPLMEKRGHTLTMTLPAQPAMIMGDPTRIIQVIANLLGNSTKYTPSGGAISLSVELAESDVILQVVDTGNGITPTLLPVIFDLFSQEYRDSDRSQGGLGIGLALVKSMVTLHNGTVSVTSDGPGKGSTFRVSLPRVD